jgi:hypothetical protein
MAGLPYAGVIKPTMANDAAMPAFAASLAVPRVVLLIIPPVVDLGCGRVIR